MESFCSDQIRELAQALIKVQEQLQPATKDANNPFTKSKYATLSTASWTRAVTPCFPTASGSASIRFPPSRDILAWSRSSPMRSRDNGSRALPWFPYPRLILREWASA